jgi:HK97 family phage major capsid protein
MPDTKVKDNEISMEELGKLISDKVHEAVKTVTAPSAEEVEKKKAEEAKKEKEAEFQKTVDAVLKLISVAKFGIPAAIREKGDKRHFSEVLRAVKMNDQYLLKKYGMTREMELDEQGKVITSAVTTTGGYMVPVEYETVIIKAIEENSVIRPLCTKVGMIHNTKNQPIVTAGMTAYWVAENGQITLTDWTIGQIQLVAKKLVCMTAVSNENLDDSDPSTEKELIDAFGIQLANAEDYAFGFGDGSTQLLTGIHNTSGIVTQPMGESFSFDDVFTAIGQVKSNKAKKITMIYNPILEGQCRKLKGEDGQYLWSNAAGATPNTIAGYPILDDYNVPITQGGGSDTCIVGGDFSNAIIGDRKGIAISMGLNDVDFEYDRVSFKAVKRVAFTVHSALANRFFRVTGIPSI